MRAQTPVKQRSCTFSEKYRSGFFHHESGHNSKQHGDHQGTRLGDPPSRRRFMRAAAFVQSRCTYSSSIRRYRCYSQSDAELSHLCMAVVVWYDHRPWHPYARLRRNQRRDSNRAATVITQLRNIFGNGRRVTGVWWRRNRVLQQRGCIESCSQGHLTADHDTM